MVSHLFYYQLALLALVWLFVMLHVAGSHRGTLSAPPATLIKPKRTRSTEPKAFEGLTHKPHCALCERDDRAAQSASASGTARLPCPRRTDAPGRLTHRCTFVRSAIVTIVAGWSWTTCGPMAIPMAAPGGSSHCTSCNGLLFGDPWHPLPRQTSRGRAHRARAAPAWRRGWAFGPPLGCFEVAPNTVLHWLVEAAEQLRAFSASFLCERARAPAATR